MHQVAAEPEVVVVGAGPSGLTVAAELQSGGVRTTLLKRRTEQESNLTRAFAVHACTLEVLDLCGVADELVARGQKVDQFQLFSHISVNLSGLPTRFPYVLVTPQYETEHVLRDRALRVGVQILTGQELVGLQQVADRVNVEVRAADGTKTRRSAAYLIGADGAHSAVRHQLSMPFSGHSSKIGWLILADLRLTERPPEVFTAKASGEDFAFIAPFGDDRYRIFVWNRQMRAPDDKDASLDAVREITRRVARTDFGMHDARWISRFHNDERQVPHYRQGRTFLVGDPAHVHSPAGAQGMNTGIQDAFNLGWKLSAVAARHAPAALLETYDASGARLARA